MTENVGRQDLADEMEKMVKEREKITAFPEEKATQYYKVKMAVLKNQVKDQRKRLTESEKKNKLLIKNQAKNSTKLKSYEN